MPQTLMDTSAIDAAINQMVCSIVEQTQDPHAIALVGIRRGGDILAKRLQRLIAEKTGVTPPLGVVDITLYRDDGFGPHDWPQVGATNIAFSVKNYTIFLVDDVLFTGRTVRAALDVILDYGRPQAVRLVVLVDRGLHELPIVADIFGRSLTTNHHEHVDVQLVENGSPCDRVLLCAKQERKAE